MRDYIPGRAGTIRRQVIMKVSRAMSRSGWVDHFRTSTCIVSHFNLSRSSLCASSTSGAK